jgi:OOP family OmpA-OmpF porin
MRFAILIAGILLAFSTSAVAQSGSYAGGSLGRGQFKVDTARIGAELNSAGFTHNGVTADSSDTAWKVFFGYQFNRNLAAEVSFVDLGAFAVTTRASNPVPGGGIATTDVNSKVKVRSSLPQVSALGILPIGDRFSVHGRLGFHTLETSYSVLSVSGNKRKVGLNYGLGAGFEINRTFGIRAEWERFANVGDSNIGTRDADLVSVGVLVRFQ